MFDTKNDYFNPFAPLSRAKQATPQSERDAFLESIGAVGVNENGQPIGSTGGVIPLGADDSSRWSALNKAEVASPAAPVATPGFLSAGLNEGTAPGLGEPNQYIQSALAKRPADRSLQEKEALKARSRAEEITTKRGGKVMGGIMADLIAEERAPGIGRREAKAGAEHLESFANGLKPYGLEIKDGKIVPKSAGESATENIFSSGSNPAATKGINASPTTSARNWRDRASEMSGGAPIPASLPPAALPTGARPAIGSVGFAMRTMPDGSVRTASGLNADGSSNMQHFDTKDAAMAFYRPQAEKPKTVQTGVNGQTIAEPLPNGVGFNLMPGLELQRQQSATPASPVPQPRPAPQAPAPAQPPVKSPFSPASDEFLKTGVAPSALDYINGPDTSTKMQTPEAARTTSPTARLEMSGGMPGAPVKAPGSSLAPASNQTPAAANPASNLSGVPGSEIFAQVTGARPTPGLPEIGFGQGVKELFGRTTTNAIWNKPMSPGLSRNLYPGDRIKNPFSVTRPAYEKGIPKRNGYQETSARLAVEPPFLRQ
jgi:hypothetical protein